MSDDQNDKAHDARLWDLPFVDDPRQHQADTSTNALNRRSDWVYEPPEEEEEIKPPTLEEIEAIREAAREEGYNEGRQAGFDEGKTEGFEQGKSEGLAAGHEEGHAAGLAEGQHLIDEQQALWQSLAETLHAPLEQVNAQARQELAKLAVTLARAVIRTEVTTNDAVIMQALTEGIKALPLTENHYQIHMHPDDIALLREQLGNEAISEKNWQLFEAPAMSRGGCDVVTSQNAVDVSIERRCRETLDKFLLQQGLSGE